MRRQSTQNRDFVLLSLFVAIIFLLAFTPIGFINLPLIKATIVHVPVIIGAVLLGPMKGAILGGTFGLASLISNTMMPSVLSFAFSPLQVVPGETRGSLLALVICFVPRILVGVAAGWIYRGLSALGKNKRNLFSETTTLAVCGVCGALVNTTLVMGMIFLFFQDAYASLKGISPDAVLSVVLGVVAANGVPESIAAAVLTAVVCQPLQKMMRGRVFTQTGVATK